MTFWRDSVGIKAIEKQNSANAEIRRWLNLNVNICLVNFGILLTLNNNQNNGLFDKKEQIKLVMTLMMEAKERHFWPLWRLKLDIDITTSRTEIPSHVGAHLKRTADLRLGPEFQRVLILFL